MIENEKILHLEIANKREAIDYAIRTIEKWLQNGKCNQGNIRKVLVCIDEILTNIISYAFTDTEEHIIDIRIQLLKEKLFFRIEDDGIPFDPFSLPPPDVSLPPEERKIGGLGIYFVRRFMDEMEYKREKKRNILFLEKSLKKA